MGRVAERAEQAPGMSSVGVRMGGKGGRRGLRERDGGGVVDEPTVAKWFIVRGS